MALPLICAAACGGGEREARGPLKSEGGKSVPVAATPAKPPEPPAPPSADESRPSHWPKLGDEATAILRAADASLDSGDGQKAAMLYLQAWERSHPNPLALALAAYALDSNLAKADAKDALSRAVREAQQSTGAQSALIVPHYGEQRALVSDRRYLLRSAAASATWLDLSVGRVVIGIDADDPVPAEWLWWIPPKLFDDNPASPAITESERGAVLRSAEGKETTFPHENDVLSDGSRALVVALSPDGRLLATASPSSVRVWDVAGKRLWEATPNGDDMPVQPRWSPDGQWLAIYWMRAQPPPKPDLGHWEVRAARTGALRAKGNGEEPIRWAPGGGPAPINSLAWFPDSKRIVLAYPSTARVVDTASGTRQERIHYGWTSETGLTVSPDGKWLGVAAWVRNESLLFALKRKKKLVLPYRSAPYSFSPGGVVFVDTSPSDTLVFAAREPGGNYALKRLSFERGEGIEACKIGPYLLPRAACAGP